MRNNLAFPKYQLKKLCINILSKRQGRGRTVTEIAKKQLQNVWQGYDVQHCNAIIPSQHAVLYKLKMAACLANCSFKREKTIWQGSPI